MCAVRVLVTAIFAVRSRKYSYMDRSKSMVTTNWLVRTGTDEYEAHQGASLARAKVYTQKVTHGPKF